MGDLVLSQVQNVAIRERYKHLCFLDYVRCHPNLRFCPGPNCDIVIKAVESVPKNCVCASCKARFCFKCGNSYHAPTDCETIRRWLTKCADDSETANYISAHTKDCPKCNICIEKNGGCNHMQCYNCKHDFCWMCLGDWRTHGSEYYECSRYKENPNIANESAHAQAREALKKYLHYFERWENHSRSMGSLRGGLPFLAETCSGNGPSAGCTSALRSRSRALWVCGEVSSSIVQRST